LLENAKSSEHMGCAAGAHGQFPSWQAVEILQIVFWREFPERCCVEWQSVRILSRVTRAMGYASQRQAGMTMDARAADRFQGLASTSAGNVS
jgi:hypothetical protein